MDENIARANIAHFRKLLETTTEQAKRGMLLQLLSEEELKLQAAVEAKKQSKLG